MFTLTNLGAVVLQSAQQPLLVVFGHSKTSTDGAIDVKSQGLQRFKVLAHVLHVIGHGCNGAANQRTQFIGGDFKVAQVRGLVNKGVADFIPVFAEFHGVLSR